MALARVTLLPRAPHLPPYEVPRMWNRNRRQGADLFSLRNGGDRGGRRSPTSLKRKRARVVVYVVFAIIVLIAARCTSSDRSRIRNTKIHEGTTKGSKVAPESTVDIFGRSTPDRALVSTSGGLRARARRSGRPCRRFPGCAPRSGRACRPPCARRGSRGR